MSNLATLVPFKKGQSGNPKGKAPGQKNYATLRREAIIEIGKLNGKSPEEIEVMLHSKGIAEALKGDYRFYKDDMDRTHGTAVDRKDITSGGKPIVLPAEIIKQNATDTSSEDNSK